jgi:hypothetical protein
MDKKSEPSAEPHPLVRIALLEEKIASLEERISSLEYLFTSSLATLSFPSAPQPNAQEKQFEILGIDTKITEANNSWSKFAWILRVKNLSNTALSIQATIEFLDGDGFVVDDDFRPNLLLPPNQEETFTGYELIDAFVAGNVASINAKVRTM